MIVTITGEEQSFSNPVRGAKTAWKVLSRVVPMLHTIAVHDNIEITIEITGLLTWIPCPFGSFVV